MNRRWVCPQCDKGTNAPSRLRRDDIRRFCLPCSQRTGRLVERTIPAVDRQRARQAAATKQRSVAKRSEQRDALLAKTTIDGVNLLQEAIRYWKVLAEWHGGASMPTIEWRRSWTKSHTSGHCWYDDRRIVVTIGTWRQDAQLTVLHELVHAIVRHEGHSERFYSILRSATRAAWPDVDFAWDTAPSRGWPFHHHIATKLTEAGA